jgi:hypothetical protein
MTPDSVKPLLAICVPTFNRASSLRNLLHSLDAVKARFGDEVEICISNNGSTDDTRVVLEAFASVHSISVQHQASNIGGTLNIIAVAGQMRANWGIWCGDDDEIDAEVIGRILAYLRTLAPETWVLVDCADLEGRCQYLRHFEEGDYSGTAFRRTVLRRGLNPFGFMGVHVFPRSIVQPLQTLQTIEAQPWPHMAGLLRHIMQPGARVHVLRETPILQAKGGALLFWSAGDLARITLSKLRILSYADTATPGYHFFHRSLMLRELYAIPNIGLMVAWKLYEPADFDVFALQAYKNGWCRTGAWVPLTLPHMLLTISLRTLPHYFLVLLFKLAGRGHYINRYSKRKHQLQAFDGIKRGL